MDTCEFHVTGGEISDKERAAYHRRAVDLYGVEPTCIDVDIDGEYVNLAYHFRGGRFERIRRITGYLTGTLDTWNDAKRAEEHDRVKHGIA